MSELAVTFHGFNVRDQGAATTDRIGPYLERAGLIWKENDYGFIFLLGALWGNPGRAERAADKWGRDAIGVGHSNGCAILWRAAMLGAFKRLVFINPALDASIRFPAHLDRVHVFHTRHDKPTKWASYVPWVRWGAMGRDGHVDRRTDAVPVINHDMAAETVRPVYRVRGHSHVFRPPHLEFWGKLIAKAAKETE